MSANIHVAFSFLFFLQSNLQLYSIAWQLLLGVDVGHPEAILHYTEKYRIFTI